MKHPAVDKGAGFFPLSRSITDHWLWQEKPFSRGQAWIDLLMLANYKDNEMLFFGQVIVAKRGTVNRSITSLADRWGWSRDKARRFLNILQNEDMVSVKATTHKTTIFITNYDKYMLSPPNGKAADNQQSSNGATESLRQAATNNKGSQYKRNKAKIETGFSGSGVVTEQTEEEITEAKSWFDSL